MSSLSVFVENDFEIVIDLQTGESFTTQAGYVRMSGKSKSTISERMASVREGELKSGEILTDAGLRSVRLIPANVAFKWLLKDNYEFAEKMGEAGATVFFQKIAGYQQQAKPQTVGEIILAQAQLLVDVERRMATVESDVAVIKDRAIAAEKELKALPPATKNSPARTTRNNINTLIRSFCHAVGMAHKEAWNNLYREFRDRCHVDLKIRASNGNCKPLDLAETLDVLEDLYAVAQDIFKV